MPSLDRTDDFLQIIENLRKQAVGKPLSLAGGASDASSSSSSFSGSSSLASSSSNASKNSEFHAMVAQASTALSNTAGKLSRLTKLVRHRSPFDDHSTEIQDLTFIIKEDLSHLNTNLSAIEDWVDDRKSSRHRQQDSHSEHVVGALKTKLAHTTKEFKDVLTARTETLKTQQDRRSQFSSSGKGKASSLFNKPPHHSSSSSSDAGAGAVVLNMNAFMENGNGSGNAGGGLVQSQMQMQKDSTDQYLESRVNDIRNIESTIMELNGMFQQLAHLVAEQGELVERIDSNMDETVDNIESAQEQILKAMQKAMQNRWLIMKVFATLIAFLFIFAAIR